MKFVAMIALAGLFAVGCHQRNGGAGGAVGGAEGSGGSMSGAGGAGPGFDGTSGGTGAHGVIPEEGSGVGAGLRTDREQVEPMPQDTARTAPEGVEARRDLAPQPSRPPGNQ
jgi:hypothetical protein